MSQYASPGVEHVIEIYDPWESLNRRIYNFNALFDWYLLLPVVKTYEAILPDYVQDRVSGFFSNISDLRNLLNALLQLKLEQSLSTVTRLVFNTTFGILGLWDPATAMGIPRQVEDFGQTLGHFGLGDGPYLVLPFWGPSNLRDSVGLIADTVFVVAVDPLGLENHSGTNIVYFTLNAIDTRHRIDFRYYETGSPFEYDLVRLFYTRGRQLLIEK